LARVALATDWQVCSYIGQDGACWDIGRCRPLGMAGGAFVQPGAAWRVREKQALGLQ
jgi:hypothetical protein